MIINSDFSRKLARELLRINAVVLRPHEPFVWSSGWNSPIYCDNRLTLLYPDLRKEMAVTFADFIGKTYPEASVITGTATAGIPHAAWVSEKMNLPMAYVRAKAKAYGMGNQIEGGVRKGESTIVIEDLISTGGSVGSVIDTLQFVGASVKAVCTIFTYNFEVAEKKMAHLGVPVHSLTDYATLIDVAIEEGYVKTQDLELLTDWRNAPETWPKKLAVKS
ncbi:MAG: orotate phosphoribosyltransferase [Balneolales bacterium]|nr:orotate phosphoribosyltransferase [Balneolales bacterium]